MLKIAVTGGAGSGKTSVCSRLKALGLEVISADDAAKQAVVPGSAALEKIAGIFGKKILLPDAKKIEGADYVVRNEGSEADLINSVDVLFENLSNMATKKSS